MSNKYKISFTNPKLSNENCNKSNDHKIRLPSIFIKNQYKIQIVADPEIAKIKPFKKKRSEESLKIFNQKLSNIEKKNKSRIIQPRNNNALDFDSFSVYNLPSHDKSTVFEKEIEPSLQIDKTLNCETKNKY